MAENDVKTGWQLGRVNVLTSKKAAELAKSQEFSARVKAHCFFSARVCEARILDRLRSEVDDYVTGKVNRDRAIANLQEFLRGEGYVTGEGLGPPPGVSEEDWVRSRKLANLAATSRLGLILDVNLREANAVRRYAEMRGSGAPYLRYVASYKQNKRPDHLKLVGMVLPSDHPFWRGFPRDYRCGCSYEEVWDGGEAAESGGAGVAVRRPDGGWEFERGGQKIVSPPNPSGFEFDAAEAFAGCDMSRIRDGGDRRACLDALRRLSVENRIDIRCVPGHVVGHPVSLDAGALESTVNDALRKMADTGRPGVKCCIKVGSLSSALTESTGLSDTDGEIFFRTSGSEAGLMHRRSVHLADYESGAYLSAANECASATDAAATLTLTPSGEDIMHISTSKNIMTLKRKAVAGGYMWLLVSVHGGSQSYITGKRVM
ncbi:MAG: hypothetical protein PHI85_03975 [Victivallaceae bacterium]|nr:hypothetical protein [Victivallaceae bacterium]